MIVEWVITGEACIIIPSQSLFLMDDSAGNIYIYHRPQTKYTIWHVKKKS